MAAAFVVRKWLLCYSLLLTQNVSGNPDMGSGDGEISPDIMLIPASLSSSVPNKLQESSNNAVIIIRTSSQVDRLMPYTTSTSLFPLFPEDTSILPMQSPLAVASSPNSLNLISTLYTAVTTSSLLLPSSSSLEPSSSRMPLSFLPPLVSPSTSSFRTSSPSLTTSLGESITTEVPKRGRLLAVVAGAAIGGVVVITVFIGLLVISLCLVRRRKKSGRHVIPTHTSRTAYREDDKLCLTSTATPDANLQDFGFGTNTFGVKDFPDIPALSDGEGMPALVFINPVDPNIPISSNTLPLRGKLKTTKRSGNLQSHFSGKESFKGYKSTGSMNTIGMVSTEPLATDIKLQELSKEKDKSDNTSNEKVSTSDYGFFLKTGDNMKVSTFMKQPETSGLYDVPKRVLKEPTPETVQASPAPKGEAASSEEIMADTKIETKTSQASATIPKPDMDEKQKSTLKSPDPVVKTEPLAPDRSHYDIPKKLMEQAKVRNMQDVAKSKKMEENVDVGDKESNKTIENETSSIKEANLVPNKTVQEPKKVINPYVNVTIQSETAKTSKESAKPEGIYDIPRPVIDSSKSNLSQDDQKSGDGHARKKPKISPRAITTKVNSLTKLVKEDSPTTEGITEKSLSKPTETDHLVKPSDSDSKGADMKDNTSSSDKESSRKTTDNNNVVSIDDNNDLSTNKVDASIASEKSSIVNHSSITQESDSKVPQKTKEVKSHTLTKPKVMARPKDISAGDKPRPAKPPVAKIKPNIPPRRAAPQTMAS